MTISKTQQIIDDRADVEVMVRHGLRPCHIAEIYDTSIDVVYQTLRKMGLSKGVLKKQDSKKPKAKTKPEFKPSKLLNGKW